MTADGSEVGSTAPRLIHYGFQWPLYTVMCTSAVAGVLLAADQHGLALSLGSGAFLVYCAGDALAEWRATRLIRRWAADHGVYDVVRLPRGGFPNHDWSFFTFAEMHRYRGHSRDGTPRGFWGSYRAALFGLFIETLCEFSDGLDDEPSSFESPELKSAD